MKIIAEGLKRYLTSQQVYPYVAVCHCSALGYKLKEGCIVFI